MAPIAAMAAIPAMAAMVPCLVLALYPPTGFDALLYHFPAAARIAASGRLAPAPELRFMVFPWLNETLYAVAMRLQDDVAAQVLESVAFLGTGALLGEACRRRFGSGAGMVAAALWLGDPLAVWLPGAGYIEPLVGFFLLAAVVALDAGRRLAAPRCHVLAGGLAGCAAATKYQGLLAVVLVAMWILVTAAPRQRLRTLLPPLAAAAAIALPWYVWIAWTTGDPLYPLFTRLTHHGVVQAATSPATAKPATANGSTAASIESVVAVAPVVAVASDVPVEPFAAVMSIASEMPAVAVASDPAGAPSRGGAGGRRPWPAMTALRYRLWPYPPGSPLLWLLWPLPLLAWRRAPAAAMLAGLATAIALAIAVLHPDARLVSVAAPLAAAAIAGTVAPWATARWGDSAALPRLAAFALLALLPACSYATILTARRGPIPARPEARERYLHDQLPGYAALSWRNRSCRAGCTVYAFQAEHLRYYAAGRFVGDWYGIDRFADATALTGRPAALHAWLAARGVDHLLVGLMQGPRGLALYSPTAAAPSSVPLTVCGPPAPPAPSAAPPSPRRPEPPPGTCPFRLEYEDTQVVVYSLRPTAAAPTAARATAMGPSAAATAPFAATGLAATAAAAPAPPVPPVPPDLAAAVGGA
jgi:hypothetical protein